MTTHAPLPRPGSIHARLLAATLLLLPAADAAAQGSWLFAPAAFTHSPATGARTTQFARAEPVEGLPDPRETVSRYWRTRTNLRGVDGSSDTIYEVRSFGNTRGGYDAQRERGFDASLETLDALRPFRFNPYLFFGGTQGFGYAYPGYPAAPPYQAPYQGGYQTGYRGPASTVPGPPVESDCNGPDCADGAAAQPPVAPQPGTPGTAYPYAPPNSFVAPFYPYPPYAYGPWGMPYGYGHGGGYGPGWGHRPGGYGPWGGHGGRF